MSKKSVKANKSKGLMSKKSIKKTGLRRLVRMRRTVYCVNIPRTRGDEYSGGDDAATDHLSTSISISFGAKGSQVDQKDHHA